MPAKTRECRRKGAKAGKNTRKLAKPAKADENALHGTWVCGKRGKPGVFVRLKEGDTDQDWGPTVFMSCIGSRLTRCLMFTRLNKGKARIRMKKATRVYWMMIWRVWNGLGLRNIYQVAIVGHVDQLSLASVAIATTLTNVTGFNLLDRLHNNFPALQTHARTKIFHSIVIKLALIPNPIS
ncbi:hypothetical protein Tco_0793570 [Tanacetum coccineum]